MLQSTLNKISKDLLYKEYIENSKSFRDIEREYWINPRTTKKLLQYYSINIRYWSEAVKSQWIGNKGKNRKILVSESRDYKKITSDGYYEIIFNWEHKSLNKGRVKEHILIMEWLIWRRLKKWEVIHHIDYDKLNNNTDNLQLMTNSEHNKLHWLDMKKDKLWRIIGKI